MHIGSASSSSATHSVNFTNRLSWWCHLACSAVRDAAIECLEEVYKVCGEQLMDVLSSHQLRPAHLNAIYGRLAQLGAHVEQTPEQSGEGKPGRGGTSCLLASCACFRCDAACCSSADAKLFTCIICMYAGSCAHEEQDTASSAGAAGSACVADEVSSMPSAAASRPATRQHSSAGQLKQQASEYRTDTRNNALAASKSVGSATAVEPAGRIKRGGFGVRRGNLVLAATTSAASVGSIQPAQRPRYKSGHHSLHVERCAERCVGCCAATAGRWWRHQGRWPASCPHLVSFRGA